MLDILEMYLSTTSINGKKPSVGTYDLLTNLMEHTHCWGATLSEGGNETSACYRTGRSVPWARSIQFVSCHHVSYTSTLILSSYLRPCFQNVHFLVFSHQISVALRMAIILKANKVKLFVSSVLFVFWYHSPNILRRIHTFHALPLPCH
jgi:hypothetical protein